MKRIVAILLAMLLVVALMAGCSKTETKTEPTAAPAETTETTEVTKLVVGTNAEFAPFEYVGDDGEYAGFDIALVYAIGAELGIEIEIANMEFDSLIPAIESGRIDMTIAAMTVTEDRKKSVTFSDNYFDAYQALIVPVDSANTVVVEGMKVGVQQGTTGDFYVSGILGENSENVVRYAKALDAVMDLANGRLDAVVVDDGVALALTKDHANLQVLTIADSTPEQYAIAMGLEDTELAAKVNAALKTLKENGTYDKIYAEEYVAYFEGSAEETTEEAAAEETTTEETTEEVTEEATEAAAEETATEETTEETTEEAAE